MQDAQPSTVPGAIRWVVGFLFIGSHQTGSTQICGARELLSPLGCRNTPESRADVPLCTQKKGQNRDSAVFPPQIYVEPSNSTAALGAAGFTSARDDTTQVPGTPR